MSMQLDDYRIAIRERNYFDVLDLALRVARAHAGPLAAIFLLGIAPFAALNAWLLSGLLEMNVEPLPTGYLWWMLLLVLWESPLATAAATLYLGQTLFAEHAEPRRVARDLLGSLPQLMLYQVLLRGLLLPAGVTWFVPFGVWPYLNEVILLERNRFSRGGKNRMTTARRRQALHGGVIGDLVLRWMGGTATGAVLFASLLLSFWTLGGMLLNEWDWDWKVYAIYWPLALWIVVGFLTVARFLGYLDLRIRREGWEVELRMRAEGARLARQWK
jgi:hypothetical protein